MRILFWNLKKNPNEKWISEILKENDIDIALFAEYAGVSFGNVEGELKKYQWYDGYGGCEKITLIAKSYISVIVRREQNRYTVYSCSDGKSAFTIAGVHLPAPPHATPSDRKDIIRDLIQDICEQENKVKNYRTIVIGDFNCNPFDEEITEKSSMNAVLFKPLINQQEVVIHQSKKYRRFYNPILHYLSEDTNTYGSIYRSNGNAQIYWNSYDQVMVRKCLSDCLYDVKYLTSINGRSLLKAVRPNDRISDHLPLLVVFENI